MERTIDRFWQIENGNKLWLAEIFTRVCLEVSPKENKPVKLVKKHWRSGIQSKFLEAAIQKSVKPRQSWLTRMTDGNIKGWNFEEGDSCN